MNHPINNIINSILFYPLRKSLLSGIDGHKGEKNVYISGYPISGNSWIAYLITFILNCKYYDIDSKEWSTQRIKLKKYLVGENNHLSSNCYDWVLKTHSTPNNLSITISDKVVYVIRNIRDVVNSQFHRFEKTLPNSKKKHIRFIAKLLKLVIPYRKRYKYLIRAFANEWAMHIDQSLKSEVYILHYEDIYENPYNELKKLIFYLDPLVWNEKVVKDAIDFFSFNKMKQASINLNNKNNLTTDRVGGSGDWKNYFTDEDIKWFEKNYDFKMKNIKSKKGISV